MYKIAINRAFNDLGGGGRLARNTSTPKLAEFNAFAHARKRSSIYWSHPSRAEPHLTMSSLPRRACEITRIEFLIMSIIWRAHYDGALSRARLCLLLFIKLGGKLDRGRIIHFRQLSPCPKWFIPVWMRRTLWPANDQTRYEQPPQIQSSIHQRI